MLKNYFTIAWRNISRNKVFSLLNIGGLSIGLCACIVIYVIASHEFLYDSFHPDANRIYRIIGEINEKNGDKPRFVKLPSKISEYGSSELSGIDAIAGIIPYNAQITVAGQDGLSKKKFESRAPETNNVSVALAQPAYFNIFQYQWLAGNASAALDAPNKVVLTADKALQYFGVLSPNEYIGKQIIYDDSLVAAVTGIIQPWNKNTDLAFTDFISFSSISNNSFLQTQINLGSWEEHFMSTWTFVKLSAEAKTVNVATQLQTLVKTHGDAQTSLHLSLQPLAAIHFDSNLIEYSVRTADKSTLYALIIIALFILTLAIVNFINLSTAQAIRRAKEVGMRKVMGGKRSQLIFQFLAETFTLTAFASLLGLVLVKPAFAFFQSFIPSGIHFELLDNSIVLFVVFITIVTAVLAGLYPAWILSSFPAIANLQGNYTERFGKTWLLRKSLVVFQFTVSLVFIISSLVIAQQLKYTREKDLGFNADAIITVNTPQEENIAKATVAADKIKQLTGIKGVALQWVPPMTGLGRGRSIKLNKTDTKETGVVQIAGNEDFIPLYQLSLLAGRNLQPSDSIKEFVINEKLSNLMGCKTPDAAIGKMLYWDDKPYPVVGVVKDFHSRSFHEQIAPACILNRHDRQNTIAIKLNAKGKQADNVKLSIAQIEKTWKSVYPNAVFDFQFYDESLQLLYQKDQQTATLMNTAMTIAIFISCLGLFALSLYTAQKRAKEISIRKILGANATDILSMLSSDFLVLIIIALAIASPVAWYCMTKWLTGFAYRINISWWLFIAAGFIVLLIACITISFQAIKAALANPVKNLRTE